MSKLTYVLNSVAASAADVTLAGGILTLTVDDSGNKKSFDYQLIKRPGPSAVASVAETLQVTTVTFTYAANTVYAFTVQQMIDGTPKVNTLRIDTSNPGLGSAALVYAAIAAKMNALGYKITVSGSGSPATFTAQTGYAKFKVVGISNVTIADTTAGVYPVNTYAALSAQGVSGVVSGNTYASYTFKVSRHVGARYGTEEQIEYDDATMYIKEGTNGTALCTRIDNYLGGLDNAGTDANPEAYSTT